MDTKRMLEHSKKGMMRASMSWGQGYGNVIKNCIRQKFIVLLAIWKDCDDCLVAFATLGMALWGTMISVIIFSSISLIYKIEQANLSFQKWRTQTSLPKYCLIFGPKEVTAQKKKEQIETSDYCQYQKIGPLILQIRLIRISIIYLIPSIGALWNCFSGVSYSSVLTI